MKNQRITKFLNQHEIPLWLITLLFQFFIVGLIMCLVYASNDYRYYVKQLTMLQEGINPYGPLSPRYGASNRYPPFYFIFMGFLGLLGVSNYIGIKIAFLIFDLIGVIYIYKISKETLNITSESKLFLILIGYWYNPFHVFARLGGENDIVATVFLLISIYHFFKNQYFRSSILLSLGILFKIFPIFFLMLVCLVLLKNRKLWNIISYLAIQIIMFISISSPFFLLSPEEYVRALFLHTNRSHTGLSWASELSGLYYKFFLGEFQISIMFIFQITVILCILAFFYKFYAVSSNNEITNNKYMLIYIVILFSVYNLITHQDNPVNWERFSAILSIIIFISTTLTFENVLIFNKKLFFSTLIPFIIMVFIQFLLSDFSITNFNFGINNFTFFVAIIIEFCIYLSFLHKSLEVSGLRDLRKKIVIYFSFCILIVILIILKTIFIELFWPLFVIRTVLLVVSLIILRNQCVSFLLVDDFKSDDLFSNFLSEIQDLDNLDDAINLIEASQKKLSLEFFNKLLNTIKTLELFDDSDTFKNYIEFLQEKE